MPFHVDTAAQFAAKRANPTDVPDRQALLPKLYKQYLEDISSNPDFAMTGYARDAEKYQRELANGKYKSEFARPVSEFARAKPAVQPRTTSINYFNAVETLNQITVNNEYPPPPPAPAPTSPTKSAASPKRSSSPPLTVLKPRASSVSPKKSFLKSATKAAAKLATKARPPKSSFAQKLYPETEYNTLDDLAIPRVRTFRLDHDTRKEIVLACSDVIHTHLHQLRESEIAKHGNWWQRARRARTDRFGSDMRALCNFFMGLCTDHNEQVDHAKRCFGLESGRAQAMLMWLREVGNTIAHAGLSGKDRDDMEFIAFLAVTRYFLRTLGYEWEKGRELFCTVSNAILAVEGKETDQKSLARHNYLLLDEGSSGETNVQKRLVSWKTRQLVDRQIELGNRDVLDLLSVEFHTSEKTAAALEVFFVRLMRMVWDAEGDPRAAATVAELAGPSAVEMWKNVFDDNDDDDDDDMKEADEETSDGSQVAIETEVGIEIECELIGDSGVGSDGEVTEGEEV